MNLPIGTLLHGGTYKIIRQISSGGFGITYEAEHVMLQKRVAIKEFFVKDFCNRDDETSHVTVGTQGKVALVSKLKKKFVEEAQAIGRLDHPNIVRVSDVFEENGTAYYVMDYIDGSSLGDIVKRQGSIPEVTALKYIRQVAEALKYVHAHHRLHLDIKPGNIMVDKNTDKAILIDFGTSKQYDEAGGENTSTLLGKTPGYAPVEQMGNAIIDFTPATDIYALGATLYKILTGETPTDATLRAGGVGLKPISISISDKTRNCIYKSMQMLISDRPQSMDEFLEYIPKQETPTKNEEGREETLIDDMQNKKNEGKTVLPLRKKKKPLMLLGIKLSKRKLISLLKKFFIACLFICIAILGTLWITTHRTNSINNDKLDTVKVNREDASPKQDTEKEDVNNTASIQGSEAVPKINGNKDAVDNKENTTQPVSESVSKNADFEGNINKGKTQKRSGTVNFGYASYNGALKNGKPNGRGTLTFHSSHKIDSYDSQGRIAESGETVSGTFVNGHLSFGKWYKNDGSVETLMIGQ